MRVEWKAAWLRRSINYPSWLKLTLAALSVRKLITPFPGSNISPALSPNGNRLAMILSKGGSPDLYVSDKDGGSLRQLTSTKEAESSPCWSPDGQNICYVSRERGPASLFV